MIPQIAMVLLLVAHLKFRVRVIALVGNGKNVRVR